MGNLPKKLNRMPQHIAIGLIKNARDQYLLTQRRPGTVQALRWEFPGGKVEPGETAYEALCRELKEEVNCVVIKAHKLFDIQQAYLNYAVHLDTWEIQSYKGDIRGVEGQSLQWASFERMDTLLMPEGSIKIKEKLIK